MVTLWLLVTFSAFGVGFLTGSAYMVSRHCTVMTRELQSLRVECERQQRECMPSDVLV